MMEQQFMFEVDDIDETMTDSDEAAAPH